MRNWVRPSTFTHPRARYHVLGVFPRCAWTITNKARGTAHSLIIPYRHTCIKAAQHHISMQQSHQDTLAPFASLSAISGTFNSLFKVLFIFPSWYLFTIGLEPIFSCRWNLPPLLRSNPEERDSREVHRAQGTTDDRRDSHPH